MAEIVKKIGLSLGADLCWPLCYEAIMQELDLRVKRGKNTVRFEVERLSIEPYSLRQSCTYDIVIDRVTHWYYTSREWIKKAVLMDDLYVFNNPWSIQASEKHSTYCAMMRLGMPIPETWMIPPKDYARDNPDVAPTLKRYARLFDLPSIATEMKYPLFMKPYDGGGWRSISRATDSHTLMNAYEESGQTVMHLQAGVNDYDKFIRAIGFGPQVHFVDYDPGAPLHDRYTQNASPVNDADAEHLRKITLTINAFFGWEFNSCESLRANGIWHPIDFANACPDSQVTSLHYHFPWLVGAYLRWSIFCAATGRKMRKTLDWEPFYKVADQDISYEEKLDQYAAIADKRFDTKAFNKFCDRHLPHLDGVIHRFFGTQQARDAIRMKVASLYPEHEVEGFTTLFWDRIQAWRRDNPPN
jgi:hypothetical protein